MAIPKLTTTQRKQIAKKRERNPDGTFARIGDAVATRIGRSSHIGVMSATGAGMGAMLGAAAGYNEFRPHVGAGLGAGMGALIGGATGAFWGAAVGVAERARYGWKKHRTYGAIAETGYKRDANMWEASAKYATKSAKTAPEKGGFWGALTKKDYLDSARVSSEFAKDSRKKASYWSKRK